MELKSGKHLTFQLGEEEYGIPISSVREIIGILDITPVPKAPGYIKGIINLRGKVVPVIDLRLKLNMLEVPYTDRSCTIVVETRVEDELKLTGVMVDTVSEVVHIGENELEVLPSQVGNHQTGFAGLGKVKERVILLIDVDHIVIKDEVALVEI